MKTFNFSLFSERICLRLPLFGVLFFIFLIFLICLIVVLSLVNGSYKFSLEEVWNTLFFNISGDAKTVVWSFRFPRVLVSILVGALLSLSGATLQNVTRNALADPSLIGVSQGAGFAVVTLTIIFPDLNFYYRPLFAFVGALIVAAFIQVLSVHKNGVNAIRFILIGIGVAAFISSLTSSMLTYGRVDRALSALAWLAGSVHSASWVEVTYLSVALLFLLPLLLWASRPMSALRMGEDVAISFGLNITFVKIMLITLSVALASLSVAAVGPLGFVGLVAPHLSRFILRCGMGLHLLISAALGAVLVSLADLIGRTAFAPLQIPAGLITAIIGVPLFVILILRGQKQQL